MFARHFCRGCPSVPRRLTVMGGLEPPDFHGVILECHGSPSKRPVIVEAEQWLPNHNGELPVPPAPGNVPARDVGRLANPHDRGVA
jgi:hypothetical protein